MAEPNLRTGWKEVNVLSDAEQHRLSEIETQLRTEDPIFVQRFDDRVERGLPRWRRLFAMLSITFAVIACGAGLAWNNVAVVVLAVTAIGAAVMRWVTNRRQSCPPSVEGRDNRR